MHRTASLNEVSTRYSEVRDEFEYFNKHEIRSQSTNNKQGSGEHITDYPEEWKRYFSDLSTSTNPNGIPMPDSLEVFSGYSESIPYYEDMPDIELCDILEETANNSISDSFYAYRALLAAGVAREQARNVLPLATYTEMYWKIDVHNLLHFLQLRLHPHAQKEIREFAEAIYQIVKDWMPITAKAFEDYKLNAVTFSAVEMRILQIILKGKLGIVSITEEEHQGWNDGTWTQCRTDAGIETSYARSWTFHDMSPDERAAFLFEHGLTNKREQQEFITKLGEQ